MPSITYQNLMTKLADPSVDEADLAPYFMVDEEASDAFAPRFRINHETVDLGTGPEAAARSALLLNGANGMSRANRYRNYAAKIASGYTGPILVAEGDSWWQYPFLLKDTIDHLMKPFAVRCLSAAGDLLAKMERDGEYLTALAETGASIMLLSGGGNDLLQKGQLYDCLAEFHPDLKPGDYLTPRFEDILRGALSDYERILRRVHGEFPKVKVIVHGYDYAIPKKQRWLGKPMERRGIIDAKLKEAITVDMMDRFNRGLRRMTAPMPHVSYVDCRGVIRSTQWHDELHPKDAGYGAVARKIEAEVRRLSARSRGEAPIFISGPFGEAAALERRAQALPINDLPGATEHAPEPTPREPLALSLHVGVNSIDAAHYGNDGVLFGCENDARAMERIARDQGFETRLLLTRDATRAAVIGGIAEAAGRLQPGDMFLFTIAAHGSFLPDWNGDERQARAGDIQDETFCLFDSQIVDDELFALWSLFRADVRIVVVGDTCHSGTQIRAPLASGRAAESAPEDPAFRVRHLPVGVSVETFRRNEAEYRGRSLGIAGIDERVLVSPLTHEVKATVLGLGACHDEQVALDGPANGAFTSALLRVWDDGRFTGDYRTLRDRIAAEIGSPRQIPSLDLQLIPDHDAGFVDQTPFAPWPRPPRPVQNNPRFMPSVTRSAEQGIEGADLVVDEPDDAEPNGQTSSRTIWSERTAFDEFIMGLGLDHFTSGELLVLGGDHGNPNHRCFGFNSYPPRSLWTNIAATVRALDTLRARLGLP
jgi:hypothetical protein